MLLSIDRLPDHSQTSKTLLISPLFILLLVLETEIRDFQTAAGKLCDCLCWWVNRRTVPGIKAELCAATGHWEQTRTRRMRSTLLWLLASLAFASLNFPADGAPMWVDQWFHKWDVLEWKDGNQREPPVQRPPAVRRRTARLKSRT